MTQRVFVIVPAFNESTVVLGATLERVLSEGFEAVLVDDGSLPSLESVANIMRIHYLRHLVNLGQGASLQTGMDYALAEGADVIVHFDADGQHDSSDIKRFIDCLVSGNYDVVLGSRFLRPEDWRAVPSTRRVLLKIARFVNGLFTGLWLTDAHNGFRVFTRSGATKIRLQENRMAHATEVLHQICQKKLSYCEIPTHIRYTEYSRTKGQTALNSLDILIDLIKNKVL